MTGQDAVKSAGEFHAQLGLTGVIMSKTDGDARGGAALSVVSVVGVPVVFAATGERLEDLELFRADRLVSRMLGMGDVLSLDVGDQLGLQERGEITLSKQIESRQENELHCPVCSGALEHGIVYCRLCGAPHHLDCWRYLGSCSLFGCRGPRYQQRHW